MTNWHATQRLAASIGEQVGDLSSGHERWRIYRLAAEMPPAWTDLLTAIEGEPDQPVASAVAVQLLERVPQGMRNMVVGVLADGKWRDFAALRSEELGILELITDGRHDVSETCEHLDSWSTWLQLRVAGEVADERILAELARLGRTRRVRMTASERLRLPIRVRDFRVQVSKAAHYESAVQSGLLPDFREGSGAFAVSVRDCGSWT